MAMGSSESAGLVLLLTLLSRVLSLTGTFGKGFAIMIALVGLIAG